MQFLFNENKNPHQRPVSPWLNGDVPSWPGRQYSPGSFVSVKPKEENRPKMAFLIFLQNTFPEASGELNPVHYAWKCTINWENALEM